MNNNLELNPKKSFKDSVAAFFHNLKYEDVISAWNAFQVLIAIFKKK
jgi:hypothetical protein